MDHPRYTLVNASILENSPKDYDGKRIGLIGNYFRIMENHSIGIDKSPPRRVWLQFTSNAKHIDVEDTRQILKEPVVAFGCYRHGSLGHLNMFMGELQRIWSIYLFDSFCCLSRGELVPILGDCDTEQTIGEQIALLRELKF